MAMTKPTSEQVTFLQTGTGATARTVDAKLKDTVSVKDFGAVGDGVTDDSAAIQLALSSGNKAVYFPTGTYVVSSQLNITPNTTISGDGIGATVINGTTLSSGFVFSCIGTALVSVGTIATASKSNFLFNLVSAPSPALEKFDVVVIWNPTTFSWNTARAYYRQGEFVTVQEVSGTTINTTSALYDTYTTATNVYKMTNASCSIKNLTIIAPQISALVLGSIKLELLVNSCIEKVKITGGTTTSIFFDKCYNSEIVSCDISDNLIIDPSDDYALSIGSCQAINITNCFVKARGGHTITLGGGGSTGSVINRETTILNCSIHSQTGFAADIHGNTEFCSFVNCNISGGMLLAGNNNSVIGCSIRGQLPTLELIRVYENKGLDFSFINNKLETISSTSSVFLFDTQAYTVLGGTVLLQGNTVIATNSTTSGIINIGSKNTSITDNHVVITGNIFNGSSSANLEYIQVLVGSTASVTGSPWSSVSFTNNICSDTVNFVIAASDAVADIIANEVYISENKMYGATSRSINTKGINKLIVKSNVFVNSFNSAVWVDGNSHVTLANAALVDVSGNTFINCVTSAPAASTSLDSDITVVNSVIIITNGNNHYNSNVTKPRVMEYIRGTTLYNGNYALTYTPRTATTDVGATVVVAI